MAASVHQKVIDVDDVSLEKRELDHCIDHLLTFVDPLDVEETQTKGMGQTTQTGLT